MAADFSELPTSSDEALTWIKDHYGPLRSFVKDPIELPDAGFKLDLESREPSKARMAKHLHQMCLLHAMVFVRSNQIKVVYLIDAYLAMVEAKNPLGTFSIARSFLELNAFLHEVQSRLNESLYSDLNWKDRGRSFFSTILRARFGTSDPAQAELLKKADVAKNSLKPFNVMNAIQTLSEHEAFLNIRQRYDQLCDYVHHNLSSQTLSNEGTFISSVARSSGGGEMHGPRGPVTRYRYPIDVKATKAMSDTVAGVVLDQAACTRWLNNCPESPFSASELKEWTGLELGMSVQEPRHSVGNSKIGRNTPCPCGSGKKYKSCCLRR